MKGRHGNGVGNEGRRRFNPCVQEIDTSVNRWGIRV